MKTWDVSFPDPRVRACFFGTLDVGVAVSSPEHTENRRACMAYMGADELKINTLYQYHSNVSLYIDRDFETPPQGDALVTDAPNLPIGVVTADCAPILFAGTNADGDPVVGACHAGARGALKGGIQSTLAVMRAQGAGNITGWLGPCIHVASYEVGQEFYDEFTQADPRTIPCFSSSSSTSEASPNDGSGIQHTMASDSERNITLDSHLRGNDKGGGKYLFDLPLYVSLILADENVPMQQIMVDTYANETECFSYRRATHRGEPDYGRQLSAIIISS